jgi:ATP-dependent DNA helicase RecG
MNLKKLKGIGEKTEKLFTKLGIDSVERLLNFYPRGYDTYKEPVAIGNIHLDSKVAIVGGICQIPTTKKVRNLTIINTFAKDESGEIQLTWFNMSFLRNSLKRGATYVFRGKVIKKNGQLVMEQAEIYTAAAYQQVLHHMQPLYALTAGLSNNTVKKAMAEAFKEEFLFGEYLSSTICQQYGLISYQQALNDIHFPKNRDVLIAARKRLVFDEFLLFILALSRFKDAVVVKVSQYRLSEVWKTEEIIERLPYQLTNAQQSVWHEIERDLKGHSLMMRLVQGDVGSGKTIIAFLSMIMTAENGHQSALMVPTEVLAAQHYQALKRLLSEAEWETYSPVLLIGSSSLREKRLIYELIAENKSRIIIGTHALIQEKVGYHSLGLVITDEQHRFGVAQREMLSSKGGSPHVLVMSATPIPRTLAIILYGDLDISIIDELPARRLPIKNCVVNQSFRPQAYRFITKEVLAGRQAYVICPMVEESEVLDVENVIDYKVKLIDNIPSSIVVEVLHGRMKAAEKNEIMTRFANNEIQVLVSTTVIEVGVDVSNATIMMIENSERFGLAQLHQLRGRVGRGEYQSYCIFMQGSGDANVTKRLKILNDSNDGFYIASEDLKLRGPGDLIGVRQSGLMEFALADIFQDANVLKLASEAAAIILAEDAALSNDENCRLQKKLTQYLHHCSEGIGL